MRVLMLTSCFAPAYLAGGPVQSLSAMVRSAPLEVDIDVVTTNRDLGVVERLAVPTDVWAGWHQAHVVYTSGGARAVLRGLNMAARRRPDYVYLNSVFDAWFAILPQMLARVGMFGHAQLLLAPRGQLQEGALALKPLRKRLFITVYRLLGFSNRLIWHASNTSEGDDIRREFGESARVIVRQNDIFLPPEVRERPKRVPGPFRIVFASRLAEKKRLHLLLRALAWVKDDYRLRVVGAFEDPIYEDCCRRLASMGGAGGRVEFVGPVSRSVVLEELGGADVFVFPTAGENFGHIIVEALSVGCPVITSDYTPWSGVLRGGGGAVVVEDTAEAYAAAINRFFREKESGCERASRLAGAAYGKWVNESNAPHFFELLVDEQAVNNGWDSC